MKFHNRNLYILTILILLMGIFVYQNFLNFKTPMMYTDIGYDSFGQFWPDMMNLHYGFPTWTFSIGLGQNSFQSWLFDPMLQVIHLFDSTNFIFTIPYIIILKILISGILFYLYLRQLTISPFAALFGAISYAFCGQMILFSGWTYFYANTYPIIAFNLLAIEFYLSKRKWHLIPLAVACIPFVQSFYLWTFSILIYAYLIFRLLSLYDINLHESIRLLMKFSKYYLVGILLCSALFLPEMAVMFNSNRLNAESSFYNKFMNNSCDAMLEKNHDVQIFSAIMRSFSTDILKTGDDFKGSLNYMEAPLFYCGLPSLLLIPQIFYFSRGKMRLLYISLTAITAIYIFIRLPSIILFAFQGSYQRIANVFVTVIIIYISSSALDKILKRIQVDGLLLSNTVLLTLAPILSTYFYLGSFKLSKDYPFDDNVVYSIFLLIPIYSIIIYCIKAPRFQRFSKFSLIALLCIELSIFSYKTVNNRKTTPYGYVQSQQGYFDATREMVQSLKSKDDGFFRIERDYYSASLSDALFQRWHGTQSYGQWNHKSYVRFLNRMEVEQGKHPSLIYGFRNRPMLSTLVGVKYLITKNMDSIPPAHKLFDKHENLFALKNTNYLPLGFVYKSYIRPDDFNKLIQEDRDIALLESFVWEDDTDIPDEYGLQNYKTYSDTPMEFEDAIAKLRKNTLNTDKFSDTEIKGNIFMEDKGLLFLSIPYDEGWTLKVNGSIQKFYRVNYGFMGTFLKKGKHKINLSYSMPMLKPGIMLSLSGLIIYMILWRKDF